MPKYTLEAAAKKQNEIQESLKSQQQKFLLPAFHAFSPAGWCNDPNGFSFFGGKCHLFFQYHPYSTQWGPMHWGHLCTSDFVRWEILEPALAPDSASDCEGCFSGTAIEFEGRHILVYTGVSKNAKGETLQNQCLSEGDGLCYKKFPHNPVISAADVPFEFQKGDFRDPKLWREDGKFYMACVLKLPDGKGALICFRSENLLDWKFVSVIDKSSGKSGMWECPDIFKLDGKDVVIFSPQEMKADFDNGLHDGNNSVYMIGILKRPEFVFEREMRTENSLDFAQIDGGIDFYAPQTCLVPDGRRIMIAWMQNWESYITPKNYLWSGMMTFPRELELKNGKLFQNPVREILSYRKNCERGVVCGTSGFIKNEFSHGDIELELFSDFENSADCKNSNEKFSLVLSRNIAGKNFSVEFTCDFVEQTLFFDRRNSVDGGGKINFRKMKLPPSSFSHEESAHGKNIFLRILIDTCSMEVFVNGGEAAFTNAFFLIPSHDISADDEISATLEMSVSRNIRAEYKIFKI
ncbi:glycoside hydrolase family 32 protein [Treponema sp.]|uniref:glycoside hydrolase family 32 protein n=1 Tax=Treponema sp. TaxID=166 RepID=UPI003F0EB6BF